MNKKLKNHGKSTSGFVEIQNISNKGIWIFINDREFFLPFTEFPWFLKATISQIYAVKLLHNKYLQWPELDVDLEVKSLNNLTAYPLSSLH